MYGCYVSKKTKPQFPVEPVGTFKHSDRCGQVDRYNLRDQHSITVDLVSNCKGFCLTDKPFSIYKTTKTEPNPFLVVYVWHDISSKKKRKVVIYGREEERMDDDSYYMYAILERHPTLPSAQKAMRRFAADAAAKAEKSAALGEICHVKISQDDVSVRVGDLVLYECDNFVGEGIVWRVSGEVRREGCWFLKIVPTFSATRTFEGRKEKEMSEGSCRYLRHCDLITLGAGYLRFSHFIAAEKARLEK